MDRDQQRVENEDWPKRTWDILPPTSESLLSALQVGRSPLLVQRRAVADFMKLPAARAMPPELRAELIGLGLLDE